MIMQDALGYARLAGVAMLLAAAGAQAAPVPVIDSSLTFWVKADTGVSTSGTNVTGWTDQSSNGANLTQGTTGSQPKLMIDGLAGLPVIRFDGSDDFLTTTSPKVLSTFIANDEYTVFVAWRPRGASTGTTPSYSNDAMVGDSAGYFSQNVFYNGSQYVAQQYNWDSNADYATTTGVTLGQPVISTGWHTGGDIYIQVLGGAATSTASGNTLTVTGLLRVGSGFGALAPYNGDIGEVLIYNRALSAAERAQVEEYLQRWLPEPSTALLLLGPALAAGAVRRRKQR